MIDAKRPEVEFSGLIIPEMAGYVNIVAGVSYCRIARNLNARPHPVWSIRPSRRNFSSTLWTVGLGMGRALLTSRTRNHVSGWASR